MRPSLKRKIKPQVGLLLLTLEGATKRVIENRLELGLALYHVSMVNFTFIRGKYFVNFSEFLLTPSFVRFFEASFRG